MSEGQVLVAVSGTIPRDDRCADCGEPYLYRLDETGTHVASYFCGNSACLRWLQERPA